MTIVDSSYAIMEGFNYVARLEGLPEVSHELTMKYIATPMPEFSRGLLGDYRPEWIDIYRQRTNEIEHDLIRPYPDTVPTLKALREKGIKLAVASNREYPSNVLKNAGLDGYFDLIVGAEEPFGKLEYKPHPDMITAILEHLHIKPENAVYVGDADIDIETAQNAGVRAIGITKGNFTRDDFARLGAWMTIDELGELLAIADE